MAIKVRSQKNLGIGIIYLCLGTAGVFIARGYSFGSAGRMGPGYFPTLIASLLVAFGLIACVRGLSVDGEAIGDVNWKGIALIGLSVCAFAFLLPHAGLVVALVAMVLIAAAASERFQFDLRATAGLALFAAFCVLVFVRGLGVPMPLLGDWFAVGQPR